MTKCENAAPIAEASGGPSCHAVASPPALFFGVPGPLIVVLLFVHTWLVSWGGGGGCGEAASCGLSPQAARPPHPTTAFAIPGHAPQPPLMTPNASCRLAMADGERWVKAADNGPRQPMKADHSRCGYHPRTHSLMERRVVAFKPLLLGSRCSRQPVSLWGTEGGAKHTSIEHHHHGTARGPCQGSGWGFRWGPSPPQHCYGRSTKPHKRAGRDGG